MSDGVLKADMRDSMSMEVQGLVRKSQRRVKGLRCVRLPCTEWMISTTGRYVFFCRTFPQWVET